MIFVMLFTLGGGQIAMLASVVCGTPVHMDSIAPCATVWPPSMNIIIKIMNNTNTRCIRGSILSFIYSYTLALIRVLIPYNVKFSKLKISWIKAHMAVKFFSREFSTL